MSNNFTPLMCNKAFGWPLLPVPGISQAIGVSLLLRVDTWDHTCVYYANKVTYGRPQMDSPWSLVLWKDQAVWLEGLGFEPHGIVLTSWPCRARGGLEIEFNWYGLFSQSCLCNDIPVRLWTSEAGMRFPGGDTYQHARVTRPQDSEALHWGPSRISPNGSLHLAGPYLQLF